MCAPGCARMRWRASSSSPSSPTGSATSRSAVRCWRWRRHRCRRGSRCRSRRCARAAPYPSVLAVLLLAAIAGVATHVPAGLGVLEAVFVACLAGTLPPVHVLAALLSYRALYYLVPLALASIGYVWVEAQRRRSLL